MNEGFMGSGSNTPHDGIMEKNASFSETLNLDE